MYIGIDLGGTNLVVGLVNDDGEILERITKKTRVKNGATEIIKDMIEAIKEIIDKTHAEIKSIGIGIPGLVDKENGVVSECVNLNWHGIHIKKEIEKELNTSVFIDNDATVASLAEYVKGSLRNTDTSILITLGTGIGGGFIINKKVYSGANGIASEIGHMVLGENFYNCNCGRNGCFETFSSASAIVKYASKLLEENKEKENSELVKFYNSNEEITSKIVFDFAKKNDEYANIIVERFSKYIAKAIVNLMVIIDPEIISFGGGVSHAGEFMLKKIREEFEKERIFKNVVPPKFVLAEMGNDAGIVGAAFLNKYQ
ncbi:ROK family protein [Helicovermis profundi]|uniref:Glucokinase n=1 Tax=Helicovermis profundi TaxID=3065157 RepID=A0AAU9EEN9_9FIRM|nr:ROK family protein [Clostridia bacterium S502]